MAGGIDATPEARQLARRYRIDLGQVDLERVIASRIHSIDAGHAQRIAASYAEPELDVADVVALELARTEAGQPWPGDPVEYAILTDRLNPAGADFWRARHRAEPAAVEATLRQLHPFPEARLTAAALDRVAVGLGRTPDAYDAVYGPDDQPTSVTASGYEQPRTAASPPRPSATYPTAVEEIRASHPQLVAQTERGGPAPQMFAAGDLPASTASGLDPAALVGLPWRVKLAAAWAPTLADAHRLAEMYADADDAYFANADLANNPAVRDHLGEVEEWLRSSGVER